MNISPKIYKINKSDYKLNDCNKMLDICKYIITLYNLKFDPKFILKEEMYSYIEDEDTKLKYFLYTYNTNELESEWKQYFPAYLLKNNNFKFQQLSLVFFIEFEDFLYTVIGGNSYKIIQPFLDDNFGIDIYSRILNPENDELLSIKIKSLTGRKAVNKIYFKKDFRLIDHIKFGSIPKEINVKLSPKNEFFNFLKSSNNEKINLMFSNSVKFKKSIDFDILSTLIKEIKHIEELAKDDYLTTYIKIDDEDLIKEIENQLIEEIYHDIPNNLQGVNKESKFKFELSHPNFVEKFYEAESYKLFEKNDKDKRVIFKETENKDLIYKIILRRAEERFGINYTFGQIKYFLLGVILKTYKADSKNQLTAAPFLYHLNCEIIHKGSHYFYLDNHWYLLQSSFLKDLNNNCRRILNHYNLNLKILNQNWDKNLISKESDYNKLYVDLENYLVFDTITIEGIELCDILYYDDNSIYLIHVKYGFDSSIRELYNQVVLSARRLQECLNSDKKDYLIKNYKSLIKKHDKKISQEAFMNLFNKKINYVMAFTSGSKDEISIINELHKVRSNIAKFSTIQASSEMRAEYYDLFFHQIKR